MVAFKPASWAAKCFAFLAPFVCAVSAAPPDDHRVVIYYQTGLGTDTTHVSLLPLIQAEDTISVTHVLIAAMHVIDDDGGLHLNNDPPDSPIYDTMWSEAAQLQAAGVKVLVMVGGAARGSYERLDGDDASFEKYYGPLHDLIGSHNIQGLDLDVEETFSLNGVIRLIDRLKTDFGSDFSTHSRVLLFPLGTKHLLPHAPVMLLKAPEMVQSLPQAVITNTRIRIVITLAPVASALTEGGGNLSGFNYFDLEAQRGSSIAFYNARASFPNKHLPCLLPLQKRVFALTYGTLPCRYFAFVHSR